MAERLVIRKACNRCHAQKLSCKRHGTEPCERCIRLKKECKSSPSLRFRKTSSSHSNSNRHPINRALGFKVTDCDIPESGWHRGSIDNTKTEDAIPMSGHVQLDHAWKSQQELFYNTSPRYADYSGNTAGYLDQPFAGYAVATQLLTDVVTPIWSDAVADFMASPESITTMSSTAEADDGTAPWNTSVGVYGLESTLHLPACLYSPPVASLYAVLQEEPPIYSPSDPRQSPPYQQHQQQQQQQCQTGLYGNKHSEQVLGRHGTSVAAEHCYAQLMGIHAQLRELAGRVSLCLEAEKDDLSRSSPTISVSAENDLRFPMESLFTLSQSFIVAVQDLCADIGHNGGTNSTGNPRPPTHASLQPALDPSSVTPNVVKLAHETYAGLLDVYGAIIRVVAMAISSSLALPVSSSGSERGTAAAACLRLCCLPGVSIGVFPVPSTPTLHVGLALRLADHLVVGCGRAHDALRECALDTNNGSLRHGILSSALPSVHLDPRRGNGILESSCSTALLLADDFMASATSSSTPGSSPLYPHEPFINPYGGFATLRNPDATSHTVLSTAVHTVHTEGSESMRTRQETGLEQARGVPTWVGLDGPQIRRGLQSQEHRLRQELAELRMVVAAS